MTRRPTIIGRLVILSSVITDFIYVFILDIDHRLDMILIKML